MFAILQSVHNDFWTLHFLLLAQTLGFSNDKCSWLLSYVGWLRPLSYIIKKRAGNDPFEVSRFTRCGSLAGRSRCCRRSSPFTTDFRRSEAGLRGARCRTTRTGKSWIVSRPKWEPSTSRSTSQRRPRPRRTEAAYAWRHQNDFYNVVKTLPTQCLRLRMHDFIHMTLIIMWRCCLRRIEYAWRHQNEFYYVVKTKKNWIPITPLKWLLHPMIDFLFYYKIIHLANPR